MPAALTPLTALALGGLLFAGAAILAMAARPGARGSALLAASLAAGFAAFSAVTIAAEGVFPVILNHTSNLWGVQVWWDLLFSLSVAFFFVLPRARAQGMNLGLWTALVLATASIGLLAMVARLFWLENAGERAAAAHPPAA
jgi:hypothetical protein